MNIALHRKIVVSNSDMRKCESLGKELLLLPWKEVRRKTNLPRNDVVWMLPFAISMTLRGNFERNLGVHFAVLEKVILAYNADMLRAHLIFLE